MIRIVFDGPPGPEAGRFVEVEDETGKSISYGEWQDGRDGYWYLVIPDLAALESAVREKDEEISALLSERDGYIKAHRETESALTAELQEVKNGFFLRGIKVDRLAAERDVWECAFCTEWEEAERLAGERDGLRKLHHELLFEVAEKYPNETRHQTAKRYLRERGAIHDCNIAQAALGKEAKNND
jgi:hypothetical protein